MSYTICIDGGGTYTKFFLLKEMNVLKKVILENGSNIKKNKLALQSIDKGMFILIEEMEALGINSFDEIQIVAGIAGIDTDEDRVFYLDFFKKYPYKLKLFNDAELIHKCIYGKENGITIVSGTGSNIISSFNGLIRLNIDLKLDTEAGSRYLVRNFLRLLNSDNPTHELKDFALQSQDELFKLLSCFHQIDFDSYNESNHLAIDIVKAAEAKNPIANKALDEVFLDLINAVAKHIFHHSITNTDIALYGGLFNNIFTVNLIKSKLISKFGNYINVITLYDSSIIRKSPLI